MYYIVGTCLAISSEMRTCMITYRTGNRLYRNVHDIVQVNVQ